MSIASLPVSIPPRAGEAIDSWLERLADANGLTSAGLVRELVDESGHTPRLLTLDPGADVVARIAALARIERERVRATTLVAHPGAVDLVGLDSAHARRTFRLVAARGWVWGHGTQLCPACLGQDGVWQLTWRLPIVAVCARHRLLLLTTCPGCDRPFRDQGHSPLRPAGASPQCENPIDAGPAIHCDRQLASLTAVDASSAAVDTQARIDRALANDDVEVLGQAAAGATYLTDLRHLATLLLHLSTNRRADAVASWAADLVPDTARRTKQRGPRWGISPPRDSRLRSVALSDADRILAGGALDEGADALQRWIALVPKTNESALGWLADRTVMTPTLTRLVVAALAPHRRLSHHLDTGAPMRVSTDSIPQVVPHDLYAAHLTGLIDSTELTVRTFASLCLARTDPAIRSWAAAAETLELPAALGVATARACSARMAFERDVWTARLARVARELPRRDFRTLEESVRHRTYMSRWYDEWVRRNRPGSRPESRTYALVWLWIHVAHAHVDTAPAWLDRRPTAKQRALYRQFEASLRDDQQQALTYALSKRA